MQPPLIAERFLGPEFVGVDDELAFEDFQVSPEELSDLELEKEPFDNVLKHNIKWHAAMLAYLIDDRTIVNYPAVTRPRWEVRVGYKEAMRRGANLMESEVFNIPGTRCANSLQHEYGHILQYRMWQADEIDPRDEALIYKWFFDIGYAENVSSRIPKFADRPDEYKVYLLKEAFVEDYRIGLNPLNNKSIFELSNAYCFRGDFEDPSLMEERVHLVKNAIKEKRTFFKGKYGQANESDRISIADQMADATDFSPRQSRMSPADHQAVVDRLRAKHKLELI